MPDISLTDWVDFVIKAGSARFSKVKEVASRSTYDPRCDFWKPLRQGLRSYHQSGAGLDSVLTNLKDIKKIKRYPEALDAYKKFASGKALEWFNPPNGIWQYQSLRVRVNPELGLKLNGDKFVVKLYFKGEKPTKHRLSVVFAMMRLSLRLDDRMVPSVLDVNGTRLMTPTFPEPNLLPMLEAEAMAFVHMWQACRGGEAMAATA